MPRIVEPLKYLLLLFGLHQSHRTAFKSQRGKLCIADFQEYIDNGVAQTTYMKAAHQSLSEEREND
jgi:hypothetical protein